MDLLGGISVKVTSNGQTLEQFDDPDADESLGGSSRSRYIEVVTGATFQVEVCLLDNYDTSHLKDEYDCVVVTIRFDGQERGRQLFLDKAHLNAERRAYRQPKAVFSANNTVNPITGETSRAEETTDKKVAPHQLKGLGSMKIIVQQVRRTKSNITFKENAAQGDKIDEVSEKMLKGRAITNTIMFVKRWKVLMSLQSLGCIARSPTPEPELREEVKKLRARLALLERSNNTIVKAETSVTTGVKRERDDREDEGARKRGRPSGGPIETVDLTGD
ncbi:MAG: hypothetical protein Q9164_001089 [Protoblastenia rupestris]